MSGLAHEWATYPGGPYSDDTYLCRRCGLETADPGNHMNNCADRRSGEDRRGVFSQKAREIMGEDHDRRDRREERRYTLDEVLYALYDAESDYGSNMVGSLSDLLAARLRAPKSTEKEGPIHVCGLHGYDPMKDDPCPGCEARHGA